jgi:hypothetical protein
MDHMKNDHHMVVTKKDEKLMRQVLSSVPGMAHFALTGPKGKICGECFHFGNIEKDIGRKKPDRYCAKFVEITGAILESRIPPETPSCRHFITGRK